MPGGRREKERIMGYVVYVDGMYFKRFDAEAEAEEYAAELRREWAAHAGDRIVNARAWYARYTAEPVVTVEQVGQ